LGLVLLVVTLAAFLVLRHSVERTERSLIEARARDTGLAVEALSAQSTAAFERAKLAARATQGDPEQMHALLSGITLPPLLSNIFLVRVGGDRPEILYRVKPDAPKVLDTLEPGEIARLNGAAKGPKDTLITWRRSGSLAAAYAAPIGVSNLVVFEEVTPDAALRDAFGSEELLDGAVYITPIETGLTLLATNAATLPITEPRIKRPVRFADGTVGTLIVAARRPLVGTFAWRAKWLVLGAGTILALLLALGVEALRRRRDRAVVLVGELQQTNTHLDALGAQLAQQAFHDSLTGLANRARLLKELDVAVAETGETPPALLVLDLDNFKEVNDLMGHHTGDALLQEVATRLLRCVGDGGLVARLGGDESAVLLPQTAGVAPLVHLAERIVVELRRPMRGHSREIIPGASIGICRRDRGENSEELVRNADIAMYRAKARDTNPRWELFAPGMLDEVRDRLALVAELKHGIQAGELTLRYQPIRDLARGRTVAGEALVRWNHPRLGVLPPEVFISIAEETGAIVELGRWVLEQACRDCSAWRVLGADVRVSVNVSGRQLLEPDIVQVVSNALAAAGLPAKHLVVEITESVLIEDEGVTLKLQQLRELGVLVAVDDFGSGYSSIGYLNKFPLDILKIDRAFVTRAGDGERGRLLESIVQLGQSLGLVAVAEGVETDADEDAVKRARCEFGQGYLFSRPMGCDEFELLILSEDGEGPEAGRSASLTSTAQ
jgi:diguanylate cyclase (GGDEF)-like protein